MSGSSWAAALESNDHSRSGAVAHGLVKLLLWHLMQPALYFYVFLDAFSALQTVQQVLGS